MVNSLTEQDAQNAARTVRGSSQELTSEQLLTIYERFGGREAFQKPKLSEWFKELRTALLRSENFPAGEYIDLLNATPKLTSSDLYAFAYHSQAVASEEIFKRLWAVNRDKTFSSIISHERRKVVSEGRFHAHVTTFMVHDEERLAVNGSGGHPGCRTKRIPHGDMRREFYVQFKKEYESSFHPSVLKTIHSEILSMNEASRVDYAASVLVSPDNWESLLADKRPVLNTLADNPLLPEEVAYQIISTHKTPGLRVSIAYNAASKELLDCLWNTTNSEIIHKAVVNNGLSGRYLTHPQLL